MIRRSVILLSFALCLSCTQAEPSDNATPAALDTDHSVQENFPSTPMDGDVTFEQMLRQYQALNRRLEAVAYRLQAANADLCPKTVPSPGYTVHTVFDYPEMLRDVARDLLSVSEEVSIRTVSPGSPAAKAGFKPSDRIIRINGSYLPGGRTAATFYDAASKNVFRQTSVKMEVERGGEVIDINLSPENLCDYPVRPYFSEKINAHTDGHEVWVTSELIRSTSRDIDLALVVAHEMAHAIADHVSRGQSKELELEADHMGLIMLARAGYDIARVSGNWERVPYPHRRENANIDLTHPSAQERLENARQTEALINEARKSGHVLTFELNPG